MKRVEVAGMAVEASSGAPLVVLREDDEPHRLLPIFIGGAEAAAIALAVSGSEPPRPQTHDLMVSLVESLDGHVDSVEVTELREGTYHASLALRGPAGRRRVDTRPSDAIALALRVGAPLFVAEAVLDEAGTVPSTPTGPAVDQASIDEAVERFRSFLDEVDPGSFADGPEEAAPDPDGPEEAAPDPDPDDTAPDPDDTT